MAIVPLEKMQPGRIYDRTRGDSFISAVVPANTLPQLCRMYVSSEIDARMGFFHKPFGVWSNPSKFRYFEDVEKDIFLGYNPEVSTFPLITIPGEKTGLVLVDVEGMALFFNPLELDLFDNIVTRRKFEHGQEYYFTGTWREAMQSFLNEGYRIIKTENSLVTAKKIGELTPKGKNINLEKILR